ncbi:MAG: molybdopterin-dependent oxidoreductase [Rubrobacteraceae bacterium]
MKTRTKAAIAGAAGAVATFGAAELMQGASASVPSVPVTVSQRIIELTPGALATEATQTVGKAATPILVTGVVIGTIALCALLGVLSLRSKLIGLAGAAGVGAVGVLSSLSDPGASPGATVLAVVAAVLLGVATAGGLLHSATGESAEAEDEPEPFRGRMRETGDSQTSVSRGGFITLAGGALVAGAAAAGAGRFILGRADPEVAGNEPAPLQPASNTETTETTTNGGSEAPQELPPPPDDASFEVEGMPELITSAANFYLIDTAISSPRINRDEWTVSISGAVDNPFEMTYDELVSMPYREADITLSCVSNEVGGGLVSHGRWTGVLLSDVLNEAGVSLDKLEQANEQLVGRSVDGWEAGFRTNIALDGREAMVVFGLNGSELPREHGYPVRLVVPGLYGYVSATKWLQEIELTDWSYDVYWIKRGWAKEGPIKTQSRIDTIQGGEDVSAGTVNVGGVAWAPTRGIDRVEVSTNGGETWNDAELATQLDIDAWRQYLYKWNAEPGKYTIQVRATDGNGDTQTEDEATPIPSGATGYHTMDVTVS